MKVIIREAAYNDLLSIHAWIEQDRPSSAARTLERLLDATERLGTFPRIGHKGRVTGTLEWTMPDLPFVIVYAIHEDRGFIDVIAVFHTARNREPLLRF